MTNSYNWEITFDCDIGAVPPDVVASVRGHLEDIGRALLRMRHDNPFWRSVRASGMRLDVESFRFHFRASRSGAVCLGVQRLPVVLPRRPAYVEDLRSP
jgi:hypothetical protein